MNNFEVISMEQARELSQQPGYILVDLRSRRAYDESHIDNALHLEEAKLSQIDAFHRKDLTWVLYCRRGSRSFLLAREMADAGYKVMAVVGGYKKE